MFFVSCSNEEEANAPIVDANSEKWELVQTTIPFTGVETTGLDMQWQEYYILNTNATFLKFRDWEGEVKEASGTYLTKTMEDKEFLELTYAIGEELIATCTGDNKEQLTYTKGGFLRGNWDACDGPVLVYEKLQK